MTRIGLISDTHGLLRPRAVEALQGSDIIVHAGDIGDPAILGALGAIAPLTAIRGNVDTSPSLASLPETATVDLEGARIYVLHDLKQLKVNPAAAIDIVVSGHSHKPVSSERSGVLYVNPGSAGPRRFQLPITVATLDVSQRPWRVEFIDVSDPSASKKPRRQSQ